MAQRGRAEQLVDVEGVLVDEVVVPGRRLDAGRLEDLLGQ